MDCHAAPGLRSARQQYRSRAQGRPRIWRRTSERRCWSRPANSPRSSRRRPGGARSGQMARLVPRRRCSLAGRPLARRWGVAYVRFLAIQRLDRLGHSISGRSSCRLLSVACQSRGPLGIRACHALLGLLILEKRRVSSACHSDLRGVCPGRTDPPGYENAAGHFPCGDMSHHCALYDRRLLLR